MKVVFISSLERSGSTILELKLGSSANVVGFGEVWRVIKPHDGADLESVKSRQCTCGKTGKECSFWSYVFTRIEQSGAETLGQRYEVFLDAVRRQYGDETVVVDSSKSIQSLKALGQIEDIDLYVLFTVRDVRGWVRSIRKAEKRKKEMSWSKVFHSDFRYFFWAFVRLNILRVFPLWLPNEWLLRNIRIMRSIKRQGLKSIQVSYEGLVFEPENTIVRIQKFIGMPSYQQKVQNCDETVHIIRGNRTAFRTDPKASLWYDTEWMSMWSNSIVASLMPWVIWYNKKWVYGYLHKNDWRNKIERKKDIA